MIKKVLGIHLVCRQDRNVDNLGDGYFKSGYWRIAERHAKTAKYLALHESKNQLSYRQGIIEDWKPDPERPGRIFFHIKATETTMKWVGDGYGEKGYYWE
jgi:hypothetical protein